MGNYRGTETLVPDLQSGHELLVTHKDNKDFQTVTWRMLAEYDDGQLMLLHRYGQPCYGEMRKYRQDTALADDNTEKPGDLHTPFPTRVKHVHGVSSWHPFRLEVPQQREWFDWIAVSPTFAELMPSLVWLDSPGKPQPSQHGHLFTIQNTNVDPTRVVQFFMFVKNYKGNASRVFHQLAKHIEPERAFVGSLLCAPVYNSEDLATQEFSSYTMNLSTPVSNFLEGKTKMLSKGTLSNAHDYNRKNLHDVFMAEEPTSPVTFKQILKELGKTGRCDVKTMAERIDKVMTSHNLGTV